MSDDTAASGNGNGSAAAAGEASPTGIRVLGQYVKDLSFENPGAPDSLRPNEAKPNLDINVNVGAKPFQNGQFEVELKLDAKMERDGKAVFIAEVQYAGLFQLQNIAEEHVRPVILIECPRLLFPFARQILAEATRQGGFPPLMIDPVDFAALYRKNIASAPKTSDETATA